MPAPAPAPLRRRRRRLRPLIPLALIGGVLLFLRTETAAQIGRNLLEQALELTLGEQVTIGAVYLEYWPPKAGIRGLLLTHGTQATRSRRCGRSTRTSR